MGATEEKVKKIVKEMPALFDPSYHLATLKWAPSMGGVIWEIRRALELGIAPEKIEHGTFETYFLKDRQGANLAVFKPIRFKLNQESLREVAAYRLDKDGFAGVPPTVLATFSHPLFGDDRTGSCQLFVEGIKVSDLRGPLELVPASEVRHLAILDIRTFNPDRHSSNVLYADQKLIPIDHNLILPSGLYGGHFVWQYWPQAKTHFTPLEKAYIASFNPEEERLMLLNEFKIDERACNLFFIASLLLQQGALHDLTPFDLSELINKIQVPKDDGKIEWHPSPLEKAVRHLGLKVDRSWNSYKSGVEEAISSLVESSSYKLVN